ncbi:MAG TPA: hypothetical protein PLC40_02630 [Candidatus Hydrogenedentes bacterium]|nr:hypothetical protein [Candidatus Hydrogenedentota bacterium]
MAPSGKSCYALWRSLSGEAFFLPERSGRNGEPMPITVAVREG